MKFRQEKEKLRKLNNGVNQNKDSLSDKTINIIDFNDIDTSILTPKILYDTDWTATDLDFIEETDEKKDVWASSRIEIQQEIEIQEKLLPFLDFNLIIEAPTEGGVVGFIESLSLSIVDNAIITGDGQTLFVGRPQITSTVPLILSDSDFTENGIPFNHGSKAWQHNLTYTPSGGGSDQNISQPIMRIFATVDLGTGCDGNNTDVYEIEVLEDPAHVIDSISSTGFSGVGNKTENRYTGTSGNCNLTSTSFENVPISLSFSSISRYSISYRNGTTLLFKDYGSAVTIVEQDFVFNGRFVFYSENDRFPVRFYSDGSGGYSLTSNPSSGALDTSYTTYTLKTEFSNRVLDQEPQTTFNNNINQTSRKGVFKISENRYNVHFGTTVNFKLPANTPKDINTNLKTYTKNASPSGFDLTGDEDGEEVSTVLFEPQTDIRYKIQIIVKPPLNWKERRKHD